MPLEILQLNQDEDSEFSNRQAAEILKGMKIMFARDFALAEQLGVTVLHGTNKGGKRIVVFKDLHFHHDHLG